MTFHRQDPILPNAADSSSRYKRELPNKDNLPPELLERAQFVGWVLQNKGEGVKPAKVPLNPKTGEFASTAEPSTWGTWQEAKQLFESNPKVIGLGFMLHDNDPYVGIDIDNCVDSNGVIEAWAAEDIDFLDSYTEVSPSKRGIRIFVKGSLEGLKGRRKGPREIYSEGRYLTLTGEVIRHRPIELRNGAVHRLHLQWFGPEQAVSSGTPSAQLQPWGRSSVGFTDKVSRLLRGDIADYASASEADLALCGHFARETGGDARRIDELFRASGLYRPKWDEQRGEYTYGQKTIQTVLKSHPAAIPPSKYAIKGGPEAWHLTHRRASDIIPAEIEWLWRGVLPKSKLVLLAGKGGLGKSQVAVSIAATVSTGGMFPGGSKPCELGRVVILSAEDDAADTIVPRLKAAGADLDKVEILEDMKQHTHDGAENRRLFSLDSDVSQLDELFIEFGDIRLLVLDPISSYLGAIDSHKNSQVRSLLAPLTQFAQHHAVTVVCITHLNKGDSMQASNRVMGSAAFVNAVRSGFIVTKDKEDPERRILAPVKNNLALDRVGYAYRIESASVAHENGSFEVSKVVWEAESFEITADDALAQFQPEPHPSKLEAAKLFLLQVLNDGPMKTSELEALTQEKGHSLSTIRRARKELRCVKRKSGGGFGNGDQYWEWWLPEELKVTKED